MCSKKMFSMMMAAVMTVGVSAGTVSAAVSYTHLDVYKRQIPMCWIVIQPESFRHIH